MAAIFPCAFFGFEAKPVIKLPPLRDLQRETAEILLPYFTLKRHSFV